MTTATLDQPMTSGPIHVEIGTRIVTVLAICSRPTRASPSRLIANC